MSLEAGFEVEYHWSAITLSLRVSSQSDSTDSPLCHIQLPSLSPLPTVTHQIPGLKSSKAKRIKWKTRVWQAYIKQGLVSGQMFLTLTAALSLGDLWLWPWIPLLVFALRMHRGPSLKHEARCWLCSQAPCLPNLPSQFPLLPAEIFPITTTAEHTCLLFSL